MRTAPQPFVSSEVETQDETSEAFATRQHREARVLLVALPFYALTVATFVALAAGAMAGPPA